MKIIKGLCLTAVYIIMLTACSSNLAPNEPFLAVEGKSTVNSSIQQRLIISSAGLDIKVSDIEKAAEDIAHIVNNNHGYIESSSSTDEKRLQVSARVPKQNLDSTLKQMNAVGEVMSERMSSRDVTDDIVDIEARLKNLEELRRRFRALLARAESVEDVLNIERELARIQTELDQIEGRRKSIIGNVEYSKIDVSLKQKRVLGPLGYIGKGIFWAIGKLFVIK